MSIKNTIIYLTHSLSSSLPPPSPSLLPSHSTCLHILTLSSPLPHPFLIPSSPPHTHPSFVSPRHLLFPSFSLILQPVYNYLSPPSSYFLKIFILPPPSQILFFMFVFLHSLLPPIPLPRLFSFSSSYSPSCSGRVLFITHSPTR